MRHTLAEPETGACMSVCGWWLKICTACMQAASLEIAEMMYRVKLPSDRILRI